MLPSENLRRKGVDMRAPGQTKAGKRVKLDQESTSSPDLEQEHRELLRDFEAPRIVVAKPRAVTYVLRNFTTYSAYEDPIVGD
jgi:hypothetical protein